MGESQLPRSAKVLRGLHKRKQETQDMGLAITAVPTTNSLSTSPRPHQTQVPLVRDNKQIIMISKMSTLMDATTQIEAGERFADFGCTRGRGGEKEAKIGGVCGWAGAPSPNGRSRSHSTDGVIIYSHRCCTKTVQYAIVNQRCTRQSKIFRSTCR